MDKKKVILLCLSILFIFFMVYFPHFFYNLPYHTDEWDHISKSIRIQEQGLGYFYKNAPIEIGFDIIILIISSFLYFFKQDIIYFYQWLPALNILIIYLIVFTNLRRELAIGLQFVLLYSCLFFQAM